MLNGFEDLQKVGKENVTKTVESLGAWTKGAQAIATESADYSKKAFEDGAAHFERLLNVRSLDRAIEAQADYLKSSYEAAIGQATRMGELYLSVARDAAKPFEGLFPSAK